MAVLQHDAADLLSCLFDMLETLMLLLAEAADMLSMAVTVKGLYPASVQVSTPAARRQTIRQPALVCAEP